MHQHIVECSCFVVFRLQGEHIRRLWADGCSLVHAATPSLHAAAPVCTLLHPACTLLHPACTLLHPACTPVHPACTPVHPAFTLVHPGSRRYTLVHACNSSVHANTPSCTQLFRARISCCSFTSATSTSLYAHTHPETHRKSYSHLDTTPGASTSTDIPTSPLHNTASTTPKRLME